MFVRAWVAMGEVAMKHRVRVHFRQGHSWIIETNDLDSVLAMLDERRTDILLGTVSDIEKAERHQLLPRSPKTGEA